MTTIICNQKNHDDMESVIGLTPRESIGDIIAANGAHKDDYEFAMAVAKNGCPYEKCKGSGCPLSELRHFGEGNPAIRERFTCSEAALIFVGGIHPHNHASIA